MFFYYVILAGHDMITDTGRAAMCRRKFKAPWLQTKLQKIKDLSKTWVLSGKQFEGLGRQKERKHYSRLFKISQWNTRTINASLGHGLRKQ